MIPRPELVCDTLAGTLQLLDRGGWDQDPGLFAIRTGYTRDMVKAGPPDVDMVVDQYAIPPTVWGKQPGHGLLKLAANVAYHPTFPPVTKLFPGLDDNVAGLAWHCEGWHREETVAGRAALGTTKFADIPGSREIRLLTAVDTTGRGYHLTQLRGEPPAPVIRYGWDGRAENPAATGFQAMDGSVSLGLLLLLLAIAEHLPPGSHALPPLPEPTFDDARKLDVRAVINLAFTGANP